MVYPSLTAASLLYIVDKRMGDIEKLLLRCINTLTTFNPAADTVDTHISRLNSKNEIPIQDRPFVQQVLYGCVRHEKTLSIFLNALYHVNASNLGRPDYNLFKVLAYLAIFRLDDLGVAKFLDVVNSQEIAKMHRFVSFMFDESLMETWVKENWCKVMDRGYVEGTLLGGLARHREYILHWLSSNAEAAFGASQTSVDEPWKPTRSSKAPTIPVAPAITQPKPRQIPMPVRIDQSIVAREVPDNLNTITLDDVRARGAVRRELMRKATQEKYRPEDEFHLHETKSRSRTQPNSEAAKPSTAPTYSSRTTKGVPVYPEEGADVKLNAGAILREEFIFRKRQDEDAKKIREYEECKHDLSEYYRNIETAKEKEERERIAAIEARKKAWEADAERAARAKARHLQHKKEEALRLLEQSKVLKERQQQEIEREISLKREVVHAVDALTSLAPKAAKELIIDEHALRAAAIKAEREAAEKKLADEKAAELLRRNEIIKEIRAHERVPKARPVIVDPTATSGLGFLDEMSLVEMRERLAIQKAREAESVERRRQEFLREKEERAAALEAKVHLIAEQRHLAATLNAEARAKRREEEQQRKQKAEDERAKAVVVLAQKLERKYEARVDEIARLEAEERAAEKKAMFLGAQHSAVEERRIASFYRAQQRSAREARHSVLVKQAEAVRVAETEARAAARRLADAEFELKAAEAREKDALDAAIRHNKQNALTELTQKKHSFIAATEWRSTLYELRDERDPYTATVRRKEQEEARRSRGGPSIEEEHARTLAVRSAKLPGDSALRKSLTMRLSGGIAGTSTLA